MVSLCSCDLPCDLGAFFKKKKKSSSKENWQIKGQDHPPAQAPGKPWRWRSNFFGPIWVPNLQKDWRRGGCFFKAVRHWHCTKENHKPVRPGEQEGEECFHPLPKEAKSWICSCAFSFPGFPVISHYFTSFLHQAPSLNSKICDYLGRKAAGTTKRCICGVSTFTSGWCWAGIFLCGWWPTGELSSPCRVPWMEMIRTKKPHRLPAETEVVKCGKVLPTIGIPWTF